MDSSEEEEEGMLFDQEYGVNYPPHVTIDGVDYGLRSELTEIIVPEGTIVLENEALFRCVNLVSVVLPESLLRLCQRSFARCSALQSIILPKLVVEIGFNCFAYCTSLCGSVSIPDGVCTLEGW